MARQRRNKKGRTGLVAGAAVAALLAVPAGASAQVTAQFNNGVLTVNSTANDAIAITVAGGQVEVNGDPVGQGVAATAVTEIDVSGGPGANDIDLKGVNGTDFDNLDTVTVDGGDGNDTINGTQIADRLEGGNGDDEIIGDNNPAGTDDESIGEAGNDTMVWNPGDGDDVNEGGTGSDTAEVNGGGDETFTVAPAAAGRVSFDRPSNPFNVDISDDTERLDLNAGAGIDNVTAAPGLVDLQFAVDIDGGDGNDVLDGSDGADLISGGNGNDQITPDDNPPNTLDDARGDAGDDTIIWNGGDDNDLNEGGDGTDTSQVNGANLPEAFTVKPAANGRVRFDRLTDPPGAFFVDMGTTERLDLNANGGDDSLNAAGPAPGLGGWTIDAEGGDGNDTLSGGDLSVDLLSGGAGADTFRTRDQTADSLAGGTEVDSAVVDAQDIVNGDVEIVDRGQGQQPGGQDTVAPRVKVAKKAVRVNRKRIAAVRVTGPANEDSTVTVKLRRKGKLLGSKTVELDAGESKLVRVKLSRKAFVLLKLRDRLQVKAVVTAEDAAGNTRKRTVELTLKEPKPRR